MRIHYLLAPLVAAAPATQALAQDAGSLLRDRERKEELKLPERPPSEVPSKPDAASLKPAEQGQTLLVRQLQFTGKTNLLDPADQTRLASSVEGKQIAFTELRALSDAANAVLRERGHLLARVIIPPQDATAGVLTLELREGTLKEIVLEYGKGTRIDRGILTGILDSQLDRQSLDQHDLESALLSINDLPGVTARSRLAPGKEADSTDLIVDVEEDPVFSASLHGDNFGSPSTGKVQGHAQVVLSDATGRGELTRLGFSYSEGQRYASAALAVPLSASGLSASLSYAFLHYRNVDPVGQAAGLKGKAHYGTLGLNYQAARSRDFNLRFTAGLGGKALTDDASAGRLADKRVISGSLGLVSDFTDKLLGGGITQVSGSWTYGDLDLSRVPSSAFADTLGRRTAGSFHRLNGELLRLQSLPGPLSLMVRAAGQWASKNLDSSESFSLGGPYGVRGWPVGEARGDAGFTATAELRYDLPLAGKLGALQFTGFLDTGKVWLSKRPGALPALNACGCNAYSLSSAGAGASWRHERFNLSVTYARGLGSNPGRSVFGGTNVDGTRDRQQFWLSGSLNF